MKRLLTVWLLALAAPVFAEDTAAAKKVTLLVTGDNRGEIAPCG